MINLTLRDSNRTSFFKKNLLTLCSEAGEILILSSGYFDEDFSTQDFSNLLPTLIAKLIKSNTKRIYLLGGQYAISNYKNLSTEEKNHSLATENERISQNLQTLTTALIEELPSDSEIEVKSLYKPRFHAKFAIKFNSNLTDNISILIGSSNFTKSSIIEGNLSYFNIESDIFLSNISPDDISFNNNLSFYKFIYLINPEIIADFSIFNFD